MAFSSAVRTGFSFGLASGIITTLGLMVGLHSGTHSQIAVLGGIVTIAVADAFSDSLGIHMSEESEGKHSSREVWQSTLATFSAKMFFAAIFIVPVLLLELSTAIAVSVVFGLALIAAFSFFTASRQGANAWRAVGEHLFIASVVIALTHFVGDFVSVAFA